MQQVAEEVQDHSSQILFSSSGIKQLCSEKGLEIRLRVRRQ